MMKKTDLTRRDFNRLSMAAFGGVVAGTFAGCAGESADPPSTPDPTLGAPADAGSGTTDTAGDGGDAAGGDEAAGGDKTASLLMGEKHVCRGLNMCKGAGAGGKNACAGQGACATLAGQECATQNACKGQGGCGEKPGENACKGMGGCHVPLKDHAWGKARANFEAAMTAAGKEVGAAPAVAPAAAS
jgi:hypothetical protein